MKYRKTIDLDPDERYSFVDMGPIPDKPRWHQELYARQSYAFPTPEAAERFAEYHQKQEPDREISIR